MDLKKLIEVYELARSAHNRQRRKSGEPYITHPIAVADIAMTQEADEQTIHACLLHDVVEDTPITLEEIEAKFGKEVAFLVDGVTKEEDPEATLDKVRKYAQKDKRVIMIKLCDRIHNTSDLNSASKEIARTRQNYKVSNPLYIKLGRDFGYENLASELEKSTNNL